MIALLGLLVFLLIPEHAYACRNLAGDNWAMPWTIWLIFLPMFWVAVKSFFKAKSILASQKPQGRAEKYLSFRAAVISIFIVGISGLLLYVVWPQPVIQRGCKGDKRDWFCGCVETETKGITMGFDPLGRVKSIKRSLDDMLYSFFVKKEEDQRIENIRNKHYRSL